MSEIIPVAKQSPRIKDGVIYWYHGDAFYVDWEVHLTDGEQVVEFQPGDELIWNFFSQADKNKPVHTFSFGYDDIHDNMVTLNFTREISNKFDIGTYTYCVKFADHDGRLVTLNATNKVKVEECH